MVEEDASESEFFIRLFNALSTVGLKLEDIIEGMEDFGCRVSRRRVDRLCNRASRPRRQETVALLHFAGEVVQEFEE
jgi:hypothetical protein